MSCPDVTLDFDLNLFSRHRGSCSSNLQIPTFHISPAQLMNGAGMISAKQETSV